MLVVIATPFLEPLVPFPTTTDHTVPTDTVLQDCSIDLRYSSGCVPWDSTSRRPQRAWSVPWRPGATWWRYVGYHQRSRNPRRTERLCRLWACTCTACEPARAGSALLARSRQLLLSTKLRHCLSRGAQHTLCSSSPGCGAVNFSPFRLQPVGLDSTVDCAIGLVGASQQPLAGSTSTGSCKT